MSGFVGGGVHFGKIATTTKHLPSCVHDHGAHIWGPASHTDVKQPFGHARIQRVGGVILAIQGDYRDAISNF
jgi:hypothetical protein